MERIPSIALIPSAYRAGKVYSVLPTDGSADLVFDRGSSAVQTTINKDGFVENVGVDIPRIDYTDGGCPSLLLEPATTNLFNYSEDLILWGSPIGTSVSADSTISPDGSLNADLVTEDTSTGAHTIRKLVGPTITATNDYSFSFFVKSNGRDIVALSNNAGSASAYAFLNITSGSVLSSTFDFISMEDCGNGWWRIKTTLEATGTGVYKTRIYTSTADGSFSHTGDGTSGLYIWGLQLEQQSYATSYIPTNGSIATRVAETASKSGLSSYINSQEGVLFAEISALADDGTSRRISLSNGSTSQRVSLELDEVSNNLRMLVVNSTFQVDMGVAISDTTNFNKIALKYKENDFAIWVNGIELITNNSGLTPSGLSTLSFDASVASAFLYGKVKALKVFNQALTDTELESLTGFTSFNQMANYLNYTIQ